MTFADDLYANFIGPYINKNKLRTPTTKFHIESFGAKNNKNFDNICTLADSGAGKKPPKTFFICIIHCRIYYFIRIACVVYSLRSQIIIDHIVSYGISGSELMKSPQTARRNRDESLNDFELMKQTMRAKNE